MRRGRDEADVALGVTAGEVVAADRQQAGELALGSGVGLDGDLVVAGDLGQLGFEVLDQFAPAGGLGFRGEGVDGGELRPGDGFHLGRGVQLHGARTQRDHGAVQGQVAVREAADVAQQLGLGAVRVEHRVLQVVGGALDGGVQAERLPAGVASHGRAERGDDVGDDARRRGLIGGDADGVGVDGAQVDALGVGGRDDFRCPARHGDGDGVEEGGVQHVQAGGLQRGGDGLGVAVDGLGDRLQPVGAVVDGVEGGHDGQQRLGGADVGRGLLAADVLLAGLQGQAVGRDAGVVLGDTHEAAGHGALEALLDGHVGGVRAAEEQRHAEALGGADGDVRALLARGRDEGQGEQVGGDGDERAAFLGLGDHGGVVEHPAGNARLLQHDAVDDAVGQALGEVRDLDLEAEGLGAALDDRDGLREAVGVEDGLAVVGGLVLVGAAHHQHGLGHGGGFVQQRGVGDRQADEVLDHGLEVQQRLEPALGDFRLVRACTRCTRPGLRGCCGGSRAE